MVDMVNAPPHYTSARIECIDAMEDVFGREAVKDFCLCNAFKYLWRARSKHESPLEDCKKSRWYIDRYIQMCEDEDDRSQIREVFGAAEAAPDTDKDQITFDDLGIGTIPQNGGIG